MTRDEAIVQACEIMALVQHSIGDYSSSADGFCSLCPAATSHGKWTYRNEGRVFDYVRSAVLAQLRADGFEINSAFSKETGRPYATVSEEESAIA
jgi:hypothetical protein